MTCRLLYQLSYPVNLNHIVCRYRYTFDLDTTFNNIVKETFIAKKRQFSFNFSER